MDAVIADAASIAVMIEGVGSRSARWARIKREDFFQKEEERTGVNHMPRNIVPQTSRFQHAVSSLSSSSGSCNNGSNSSSGEEAAKKIKRDRPNGNRTMQTHLAEAQAGESLNRSKNVSNSGGSSNDDRVDQVAGDYHDYHAQPLPDPKLADSERSSTSLSDDSPAEESNNSADDTKRVSTDSSSGDDSGARPAKRRKHDSGQEEPCSEENAAFAVAQVSASHLPKNIAKKGGISHNVRPISSSTSWKGSERLSSAPASQLPPFAGIGKKSTIPLAVGSRMSNVNPSQAQPIVIGQAQIELPDIYPPNERGGKRSGGPANGSLDGPAVISGDVETSSSSSSRGRPQIRAYYHVNEDDMILMDDVLMCPFVFRTQDAVLCGSLAECVMPGMLRGSFSPRNKLLSMELVYDAMGFMQQLERASGCEVAAQIIPGSLEMALSPSTSEARVITLAESPFLIVNVNEAWTRMTKYTQMEAEGLELWSLLQGGNCGEDENGNKSIGNPNKANIEDLLEGRPTCSTRVHYDKEGREFVDFICSYPLTK